MCLVVPRPYNAYQANKYRLSLPLLQPIERKPKSSPAPLNAQTYIDQWENPRASAIAFAASVTLIFLARYLNIVRYSLKLATFALGGQQSCLEEHKRRFGTHIFTVTATLEILGKVAFNSGLSSRMRPRKYYTIPREALERNMEDLEQLLNFFVIESQRILFAENIAATVAVRFNRRESLVHVRRLADKLI